MDQKAGPGGTRVPNWRRDSQVQEISCSGLEMFSRDVWPVGHLESPAPGRGMGPPRPAGGMQEPVWARSEVGQ